MKKKAKGQKKLPRTTPAKPRKKRDRPSHPAMSQSLSLLSEISQEIAKWLLPLNANRLQRGQPNTVIGNPS